MLAEFVLFALQAGSGPPPPGPPLPQRASGGQSVLEAMEEELHALYTTLSPVLVQVQVPVVVREEDGSLVEERISVSGVVLDRGGLIVAPGMMRPDALGLIVIDAQQRAHPARLVAQDKGLGLCLLQAGGLDLPPPELGCADAMQIGSVTVSLGNAYGLEGTLDVGYLSGKRRTVSSVQGLLQITNNVNLGDGGGLLANRHGQLVGILFTSLEEAARRHVQLKGEDGSVSMKFSRGVSFAVPIDRVLEAFAEHLERKPADRRTLGVELVREPWSVDLPQRTGLKVVRVTAGSAAARAGIRADDILLRADGKPICTRDCLAFALLNSGERMSVVVLRGDRQEVLQVRFSP